MYLILLMIEVSFKFWFRRTKIRFISRIASIALSLFSTSEFAFLLSVGHTGNKDHIAVLIVISERKYCYIWKKRGIFKKKTLNDRIETSKCSFWNKMQIAVWKHSEMKVLGKKKLQKNKMWLWFDHVCKEQIGNRRDAKEKSLEIFEYEKGSIVKKFGNKLIKFRNLKCGNQIIKRRI